MLAQSPFPTEWWAPVMREGAPSWEILPQDAKEGEVILSKRNELGVFSNLAATAFIFEGEKYASIEGLWQMMKYPDLDDVKDPRLAWKDEYPFTRQQVKLMSGFEAKDAGDAASKINKEHKIDWVTYRTKKFNYKDGTRGSEYHYQIIFEATFQKVKQNPEVKNLLLKTRNLKLMPDHLQPIYAPKSYGYFNILMDLRKIFQLEEQH